MKLQISLRGTPVRTADAWVVVRLYESRESRYFEPLRFTVAGTRDEAIRKYDALWEGIPNAYRRARRRGEVLAVHCLIEPLTFERK